MTMKKEEFIKLGLDEDAAKKCAEASETELKTYIPKARFDEVNNEKKKLELDVRDRDGQLETLKKSTGDVDALTKRIETLQAENKTKDEKYQAEIKQMKVDSYVEQKLKDAQAKNIKATRALLDDIDMDKVKIKDDGSIEGLDSVDANIKKIKESEDSKFMFNSEARSKPKVKGAKVNEKGDNNSDDGVNLDDLSYEELAKYLDENPDAANEIE